MRGDPVPDADHIIRYIGGSHIENDENGEAVALGSGFIARPRDDHNVSYNWLELLGDSIELQVAAVRAAARIEYKSTARLARLNVGTVRAHILDNTPNNHNVTVIEDPLDAVEAHAADPSHALMTNMPNADDPEGELIGDLIAECVIDLFLAKLRAAVE